MIILLKFTAKFNDTTARAVIFSDKLKTSATQSYV